ncbi:NIPSNAP family protein [Roseiconus lacunae]|uniref:NIPSNAP family protein n=1 Tax=Roseiconus lacunae TaxID=2605694 RepID=UPI001E646DC2|nr:NIPSNAP family protein [Roseiconus lacunae]MCD0460431.1 NIPSNAP family protein [Roseiconus lacunae]
MPTARSLATAAAAVAFLLTLAPAVQAEVYELRIYKTNEGKLDALNARFRDHTMRLFKKHGIESMGYWVPTDRDDSQNTLIYVIKHESRDAAKESWKNFLADPEWKKAAAESGVGRLAERPESTYMELTDYSPEYRNAEGDENDVFELRIYEAAEGKLDKLDARFRDHTIGLFAKHGIKSVAYWHPTDSPDSENTLIYIVEHESDEAAQLSWKSFAADPEWKKAAAASGVGRLAKRPTSIYMTPTDYSPIK